MKQDLLGINQDFFHRIIKVCSPSKIVLWVLKDSIARNRIQQNEKDSVRYEVKGDIIGSYKHLFPDFTPYLVYQFYQSGLFQNFWISEDKAAEVFNKIIFDYELLYQYGYSKPDVDSILLKLGAKDSFNKLSIDHISNRLMMLPKLNPYGNDTQKIYKLVLNHFRVHGKPIRSDVKLFAKTKTQEDYYKQIDIFYSDNIKLPSKIIADKPILNFPKRSGNKQVTECFNIKNLNEIEMKVIEFKVIKTLSEQFENVMQRLKPYLLAYRFDGLQANQKSNAANLITNKSIILCNKIECSCEGNQVSLNDSDYIQEGNIFYIKVDEVRTIEQIQRDSNFGDTFAEIICSIFTVNDNKSDFRNILRDDEQDVEHQIRNEMGSEILEEARKFLGISDRFISFWNSIFINKNIKPIFEIDRSNANLIEESFGLENNSVLDIDYDCFSRDSIEKIIKLFGILNIELSHFNEHTGYKLLLADWHYNKLSYAISSLSKEFKFQLWKKISTEENLKEAKSFLSLLHKYDRLGNWAKTFSSTQTENINIDHLKVIKSHIEKEFCITLSTVNPADINKADDNFQKNIRKLKIRSYSDLPNEISSLLYFDCYKEQISAFLDSLIEEKDIEGAYSGEIITSPIPNTPSKTVAVKRDINNRTNVGGRKFSANSEKSKSIAGQKAEEIVYHSLVAKYGVEHVEHCSLRSDTFGYDIKYSADKGKTTKLVEVKRFTRNMFYLSENEYRVANNNKNDYQIFLVSEDNSIYIVDQIDFNNDRSLTIIPSEYKVFLKLKEENIIKVHDFKIEHELIL